MSEKRIYCPLAPCKPPEVLRPDAYGSASFPTMDAYLRHMKTGHFISPINAPKPYRLSRNEAAA